ncbi:hypothetical protein ACFLS1_01440 [Verrucomicrobiota bacterium]
MANVGIMMMNRHIQIGFVCALCCLALGCASFHTVREPVLDVPRLLGVTVAQAEAELGQLPLGYPDIPTIRMRMHEHGPIYLQLNYNEQDTIDEIIVSPCGDKKSTHSELCALANIDPESTAYTVGLLRVCCVPEDVSVVIGLPKDKKEEDDSNKTSGGDVQ